MAIDLSRFFGTFFEEASEHLEAIEEHAMALASGSEDGERLNAIFRAAHSIKGGAATFGFTQLAEATHELETLFDGLRRGEGSADDRTVRLLLDACDVFKEHLARLRAGSRDSDAAMQSLQVRLAGAREALRGAAGAGQPQAEASPHVPEPGGPRPVTAAVSDPALRGELERALAGLGDVLDPGPGDCVRVATRLSLEELREALAFALPPEAFTVAEEAPAGEGTAYGLFEPETPAGPEAGAPPPGPAPAARPPASGEGERYGFFTPAPETPAPDARSRHEQSSIRVSVDKIDRIVNLVGELVIAQAMLQQAGGAQARSGQGEEQLAQSLASLDRSTRDLQQAVMAIRMMPMEFVFSRFPRLVYDVSSRLGKKVQLRTHGHETELDKEMIELIIDPLTHVVRNSIDHGIEEPADRLAAGKPETGTVGMRATHRGGSVVVEVFDDGRGLDRERILAKARELGMEARDGLSDTEVWGLIFEPGFSTARQVTELSGRGVGMDVVRRNIGALGGSVSVESTRGAGTTIRFQLPLTLAVLDGMIVSVADEHYIVPLEFVAEAFKPGPGDLRMVVNQPSIVAVRGEHLPIVRLEDVVALPESPASRPEPLCLVVEVDGRRAALLVDSLVGQQQVVVKALDTNLHAVRGISGATILGDGRVALILDVSTLARTGAARAPFRSAA